MKKNQKEPTGNMNFPQKGDRVIFKGTQVLHYPQSPSMIEAANNNLVIGREYCVSEANILSSWCNVILEEVPGIKFNWSFFGKINKEARWIKTDDECPYPGETALIKQYGSNQIELALYTQSKTWILKNYATIDKPEFWIRAKDLFAKDEHPK